MLDEILTDIAKRRGQPAADRLRDGINALRVSGAGAVGIEAQGVAA